MKERKKKAKDEAVLTNNYGGRKRSALLFGADQKRETIHVDFPENVVEGLFISEGGQGS